MNESSEDIWDDTLLVKAYDNSVKLEKAALAKRIAQSTNKLTDSSHFASGESSKIPPKESEEIILKIGSYVRATYQDDIDYEAKIIAIDENGEKCTIKYIGYDNEEEVMFGDLVQSWGKKSRSLQFAKAKQTSAVRDSNNDNAKKPAKSSPSVGPNHLPPPPPMPPILNDLNEDSEHISAMLMAWYMSGYYTGLYQGQKISKAKLKNKK